MRPQDHSRRPGLRGSHWIELATAVVIAYIGTGCSTSHGDPDPGGAILQSLRPAFAVIPETAHGLLRQAVEPHWDSCDGRSGTFGWDNAIVMAQFHIEGVPASQILADADRIMSADGWTKTRGLDGPLGAGSEWTRAPRSGVLATASLSPAVGPSGPEWDLYAWGPPSVGGQADAECELALSGDP